MKVFVITKNADWTEGKGPMIFDKVCSSMKSVRKYLNTKTSGIFGAKPKEGQSFASWVIENKHGGWAGYEIKEVEMD